MSAERDSTSSTCAEYSSEAYTIGIICALPIELAAAVKTLDQEHPRLVQNQDDDNSYRFGRIGDHNIVIGCLAAGRTGHVSAASVALKMKSSFSCIRFGLMVGIGGGVPTEEHDIRLGDIVVSQPAGEHGGIVQYDFGKSRPNGVFERTGFLSPPPNALLTTLTDVIAAQEMDELNIAAYLSQLAERLPAYNFPSKLTDDLYQQGHLHQGGKNCLGCGIENIVQRGQRDDEAPAIHYGTIASGNRVMKDAIERDKISQDLGGVLCFEMEAAGLMNNFPCLVIRGISDYSDSHKNDGWQRYAAATAAAFAKELLNHIAPTRVAQTQTISQIMGNMSSKLAENTNVTQKTEQKVDSTSNES
jgi:nucleoside phosphorylase